MGDASEEHLVWLVDSRSRNQKATVDLYVAIKKNGSQLEANLIFQEIAQDLVTIAFSLWRAVFLSDITEDVERKMQDADSFLDALIRHNAIAYPQDRSAREWTFQYYLNNARQRLISLARRDIPKLIDLSDIERQARSAKDDWMIAQLALEKAVAAFGS